MALQDTAAAGQQQRLDLGSLFCLIGRHGPAVLLAAAGIAAVLLVALFVYRSLRRQRWRGSAGGPAAEPGGEAEEDLQSREATDADTDKVPPDVTEELDGTRRNLKVRRRQVVAALAETTPPPPPPPPPPTPSFPPPTRALAQQLSEEANEEPEEPEHLAQESEKVSTSGCQEGVTTDPDVAEKKLQCPTDTQTPQRDQVAIAKGRTEEPSEKPSKEPFEEPLHRPLEKPLEEPLEEPDHRLRAVPPPAITSNQTERLDKENLKSVEPQVEVVVSAKEEMKEDGQRLEEKQDEEEKKEEEREVQEDVAPVHDLPLGIATTREDVQDDDRGPAVKEHRVEAPSESIEPQTSQMDLQTKSCDTPFDHLGEELLTSYIVVNSNCAGQISGAEERPDWSPAADQTEAPFTAPPHPPLPPQEPEIFVSCNSEDPSSWTGKSTPDHLVLVSNSLETKHGAPGLQHAMAGSGAEQEEDVRVEVVKGEPCSEMLSSHQKPEGHHHQEVNLLSDSTQTKEELHPDSAQEEGLFPSVAQKEELNPCCTPKEELLHNSPEKAEELLPDFTQEENQLHPDSAQKAELPLDPAQKEELLYHNPLEEAQLLPKFAQEEEQLFCNFTPEEELPLDSIQKQNLHLNSTQEEKLLCDPHQEETQLYPDSAQKEALLLHFPQEEVQLAPITAQKEELPLESSQKEEPLQDSAKEVKLLSDSTQKEELHPDSAQEEGLLLGSSQEEEQLLPSVAQKEELNPCCTQEEELLRNSPEKAEELLPDFTQEENQLHPDSAQKAELPPDPAQKEELLPKFCQEEEQLFCDFTLEEELPLDSIQKEKLLCDPPQEETQLHPDSAQKEVLLHDLPQEEVQLAPDTARKEELPLESSQKEESLQDSVQEEEMLCRSTQKEVLSPECAQWEGLLPNSVQEEELAPQSTQDDTAPPVTAVSWWSSEGRDPAPGDWIVIPQFLTATNEDMFGHQVESEYQLLMDQFVAQVEASLKVAVEVIEREGVEEEEEEVGEEKKGGRGEEEVKVKEEENKKAGAEEEQERRTEISIMEATMDANEWVTESGHQLPPWMGVSSLGLVEESSTPSGSGSPAPRVAAVPPLLPQTVEVTFRLHYLTWSERQTLAVTGSQPELGSWTTFVLLERDGEGEGQGQGLWTGRVRLPTHSQLEWKFVVLDKGRVSRWEECGNRVLVTGDQDQLVHGWWGKE